MISLQTVKILALILTLLSLFWISNFAYKQVKKPLELDNIPFIMKNPCSIKYLINQEKEKINDLSLYYSGIKEEIKPDLNFQKKIAEEKEIEEKLLKIAIDEEKEITMEEPKVNKVLVKKELTKKTDDNNNYAKKTQPKNDAFTKKKPKSQDTKSVFDLAEE